MSMSIIGKEQKEEELTTTTKIWPVLAKVTTSTTKLLSSNANICVSSDVNFSSCFIYIYSLVYLLTKIFPFNYKKKKLINNYTLVLKTESVRPQNCIGLDISLFP